MIVISDTGPLNYLVLIGHIDTLPILYDQVVIPPAVVNELSHSKASRAVQAIMHEPPTWLKINVPAACDPDLRSLGDGEQQAITLAQSLRADLLLCDDQDARKAARERGVRVIGTLGVIQDAARSGLLDLNDAFTKLQRTNFRISKALIEGILKEWS